jgi:formamidopyrimidine-DNA glycosylase
MPELPEVETIARGLCESLVGRTIVRASLRAPDLYRRGSRRIAWINGCRVRGVSRLGKAIHFDLLSYHRHERVLIVHLGMTGRFGFYVSRNDEPRGVRHRHGRWAFSDGSVLHYVDPRRFGFWWLGHPSEVAGALGIGPDPFQMKPRALERVLSGRTASIKSLLLNQRLISGLGNIYVDELLFAAGIHPGAAGGEVVDRAGDILSCARRVLRRAIKWNGTTFRDYRTPDGARGSFQLRLSVYGREGETCRKCGNQIEKLLVAGRGTHVCPRCQAFSTATRGSVASRRPSPKRL